MYGTSIKYNLSIKFTTKRQNALKRRISNIANKVSKRQRLKCGKIWSRAAVNNFDDSYYAQYQAFDSIQNETDDSKAVFDYLKEIF